MDVTTKEQIVILFLPFKSLPLLSCLTVYKDMFIVLVSTDDDNLISVATLWGPVSFLSIKLQIPVCVHITFREACGLQ